MDHRSPTRSRRAALLFAAWLPLLAACSSLGAYPRCADVYRLRPEEYGHVFCHAPQDPKRDAETTRAALQRNADRRTVRDGVLDADRAIEQGNNP